MIWFTSDLHFCHDREFLFKPRGFDNIDEMNNAIVERWNNAVDEYDEVYILGDLMLNNNAKGEDLIRSLNGRLHIVIGNHDTDNRVEIYRAIPSVVEITYATMIKYEKLHFFLTHYPCLTGNLEKEHLSQMTLNLFGHTHSKELFFEDRPYMYNVSLDAHDCTPVNIETVKRDMLAKIEECKAML